MNKKQGWLGLAIVLLAACEADVVAPVPAVAVEPASVKIATLQAQTLQPNIEVVGVVQAAEQVELSADISAPVAAILVQEGQAIQRGDLLIELDAEKLQLRLVRAQEALKRAQSRLTESAAGLKRRQRLAQQQTLSQELLDSARHDWQRSQAAVQEAQAAVALAERERRDSQLISPVDGVIDRHLVEVGETVHPGTELISIQATNSLELATFVSARDINYLQPGALATVLISDWQQRHYSALVQSVGIAANPRTGNFPVTLLLTQTDKNIRPGMTARISMQGRAINKLLLLPELALVDRGRKRVVFVVEQGVAVLRQPRLNAGFNNQLIIVDGLLAGEQVIVDGLQQVVDGSAVTVLSTE